MNNKRITSILFVVISILFSLSFFAHATQAAGKNWFVRPWGGSYGAADGASYAAAWNGLDGVKWGTGGVQAGDTLWVCGVHGVTRPSGSDDYVGAHTMLTLGASGTSDQPITIRGDCHSSDSTYADGVIYRTTRLITGSWTTTGVNGVYAYVQNGSTGSIYEDEQLMSRTRKTCSSPPTTNELNAFGPGDWCKDTSSSKLYLKPKVGNDPNSHVYEVTIGDPAIILNNHNYIVAENLKLHGGYVTLAASQHLTLDNFEMTDAAYGVTVYPASNFFTLKNSKIDMVGNGVYFIWDSTQLSSDNSLIEHNTITNVESIGNGAGYTDQHAIGIQGGVNHIVRYNRIDNAATGPCFYDDGDHPNMSAEIYGNYVTNIYRLPDGDSSLDTGHGDAYFFMGPSSGNNSVYIHDNIARNIANSGVLISTQNLSDAKIYNNVIDNANIGIATAIYAPTGVAANNVDIRNNIITNLHDWGRGLPLLFIYAASNTGYSTWSYKIDNNIYYPSADTSTQFYFRDNGNWQPNIPFSTWRSKVGNQEVNSKLSNPIFTNASGNFSQATDFQLAFNSPAIDAGTNVGLASDYAGTSVPQGSAPDIGAYEYTSGTTPPPTYSSADLNQDGSVNATDFCIIKTDFFKLVANLLNPRSDIDLDGQVTAKDVGIMMSSWKP